MQNCYLSPNRRSLKSSNAIVRTGLLPSMAPKVPCATGFPGSGAFCRVPGSHEFLRAPRVPRIPESFQGSKVPKFPKNPKLSKMLGTANISNILLDLQSSQGYQFLMFLMCSKIHRSYNFAMLSNHALLRETREKDLLREAPET